jgi:hypothetical protein
MNRFLVLLFGLLLSGCYGNQKQELGACALEAGRHTTRENVPAGFPLGSDYVEACMRARGFELNQDQCPKMLRDDFIDRPDPAVLAALSNEQRKAYTEHIEKAVAALAEWRKVESTCYEPTGWFGKRVLWIEKRLEACTLGGCFRSREDAQIELIECAGFQLQVHQSGLMGTVYEELKRIGTQPVDIQAIPTLANAYVNTYTVTKGRGAEVTARWDKGVSAAKKLAEKRDVRQIARYLKSCVGTFSAALRD